MDTPQTLLSGSSDMEKGAYLGAIASIATADRQATPEEIEYISALCESANLSTQQKQVILDAANDISGEDVRRCLDVLKTSDLKYSLIADLIAFAKSDSEYSEEEQQSIHKMAEYLGVDQKQYSVLDQFVQKASASSATPEEASKPDFLSSLGFKDKLQSAGINGNSLLKGLLGIAGPMILAKMITGGLSRNRSGGGMFGGGGGMFGGRGGGMFGGGGGLGSIISMINGGRGVGSTGGLFSRIFGRGGGF
nr:Tellurite resistance protein TerB [uncultured bacterium]